MATFQKRGEKWRVMVRRQGHAPVSRTFESHEAGKKWADELEGRISGEVYVDRAEAKATKLRDLLERYRDEVTPTKKGADREKYKIKAWLADSMADWSALAVLPKDIAAWRRAREAEGKAPSTINNSLNLLSAIYKTAITEWGLPLTNPCTGVRRVKQRPGRNVRFSDADEVLLLAECGSPGWLKPLVILAIETGARQGELLALEWPQVFADHVHIPKTKNGEARDVPLPQRARDTLAEWRQASGGEGKVFTVCRSAVDQRYTSAVDRAVAKGGVDITFHDLRHIAATRLAKRLQPLELARVLGHKTMAMTLRYYNPTATDLAAKIDGKHSGAGLLEEFRAVVERVRAAGLDPAALLAAISQQSPEGKAAIA